METDFTQDQMEAKAEAGDAIWLLYCYWTELTNCFKPKNGKFEFNYFINIWFKSVYHLMLIAVGEQLQ